MSHHAMFRTVTIRTTVAVMTMVLVEAQVLDLEREEVTAAMMAINGINGGIRTLSIKKRTTMKTKRLRMKRRSGTTDWVHSLISLQIQSR